MPAFVSPHSSPYARLVANVVEDGSGCWLGIERSSGRGGYQQVNFRVPGLGRRVVKFSAHILTWIASEARLTDLDDLYLAYVEFRQSGLVLDHTCNQRECRNPSHLDPCTQAVNIQRMHARRSPRCCIADGDEVEF